MSRELSVLMAVLSLILANKNPTLEEAMRPCCKTSQMVKIEKSTMHFYDSSKLELMDLATCNVNQ